MQGLDQTRAAISAGLAVNDRESDVDKFIRQAEGLVAVVIKGTDLSADDDRVRILGFRVGTPDRDGNEGASVAAGPRHSGLFPFPHSHCVVEVCWWDEEDRYVCLTIELPCDIEWPILGRL